MGIKLGVENVLSALPSKGGDGWVIPDPFWVFWNAC